MRERNRRVALFLGLILGVTVVWVLLERGGAPGVPDEGAGRTAPARQPGVPVADDELAREPVLPVSGAEPRPAEIGEDQAGRSSTPEAVLTHYLDGALEKWLNPDVKVRNARRIHVQSPSFKQDYLPKDREISEAALEDLQVLINDLEGQINEARVAIQIEQFEAAKKAVAEGNYEVFARDGKPIRGLGGQGHATVVVPGPTRGEVSVVRLYPDRNPRVFAAYDEKARREKVLDRTIREFIESH